jgi:pSer/pThr/pTyr-binding forkhead associated (FHA) protein
MENMKKCPHCQAEIEADSFFCDQCGNELKICLDCGTFVRGKFCSNCRSRNIVFAKDADSASAPSEPESTPKTVEKEYQHQPQPLQQQAPAADMQTISALQGINCDDTIVLDNAITEYTIGRKTGEFTAIFGSQNFVSRQHAKLINSTEGWQVVDLGSTNGTYVNNTRLTANNGVTLTIGDEVRFASLTFKCQ